MKETQTIIFNVQTIKKLILNYYKKYFKDINLNIKYNVFEGGDYSLDRVEITITRKIKIGNYEAISENILFDDDVINVLNEELEKYGYKISFSHFIINNNIWNGIKTTLEKIKVNKKVLEK